MVCYSGGGHTRVLAHEIAAQCGADIDEIKDRVGRRGLTGYLRSVLESLLCLPAPIDGSRREPGQYDTVIIGTPVWSGRMASPVRAYLRRHRGEFRRVAVFCTATRGGQASVLDDVARLAGCRAAATLALTESEVALRRHWAAVTKFVRSVRRARGNPGAAEREAAA